MIRLAKPLRRCFASVTTADTTPTKSPTPSPADPPHEHLLEYAVTLAIDTTRLPLTRRWSLVEALKGCFFAVPPAPSSWGAASIIRSRALDLSSRPSHCATSLSRLFGSPSSLARLTTAKMSPTMMDRDLARFSARRRIRSAWRKTRGTFILSRFLGMECKAVPPTRRGGERAPGMRTRSGKTYFACGEERCPVCLEPSWQPVGGRRLLCVEGCGCPVPTLHAHCYLMMTAAGDVAETRSGPDRCPACTAEIAEPRCRLLDKAQFNHDTLRDADPGHSPHPSVAVDALVRACVGAVAAARAFDRETRRAGVRLAHDCGYMAGLARAASVCLAEGMPGRARRALAELSACLAGHREYGRLSDREAAAVARGRLELEARVLRDAGLD